MRLALRVGHLEVARQIQDRGLARVIALSAHTRVLMATGDLAAVEERMRHLHHATQLARTPLRSDAYAAAALRRLSPRR